MAFSDEMIQKVWDKAPIKNQDPMWANDECGAWINRAAYGKQSEYGWNIDHIVHKSKGGGDELSNLRPLHWENNTARADGRLVCVVKSSGSKNIRS